jgi:hypothetical protein
MTTTVDLQEAFCCSASTALQVNDALPTGKSEPDVGEHVVVIGVPSPVTLGVSVTDTAFPSNDVNKGEGHEMARGSTVGNWPDTSDDGAPTAPSRVYDRTK